MFYRALYHMKQFIHEVGMTSGKYRAAYEAAVDRQKEEFKKCNPSLEEKRLRAIEYLGEKWILHQKHAAKSITK